MNVLTIYGCLFVFLILVIIIAIKNKEDLSSEKDTTENFIAVNQKCEPKSKYEKIAQEIIDQQPFYNIPNPSVKSLTLFLDNILTQIAAKGEKKWQYEEFAIYGKIKEVSISDTMKFKNYKEFTEFFSVAYPNFPIPTFEYLKENYNHLKNKKFIAVRGSTIDLNMCYININIKEFTEIAHNFALSQGIEFIYDINKRTNGYDFVWFFEFEFSF